jgi:phage shock protein C
MNQMLYRPTADRKIAGVAAGLGYYFGFDPTLVRLVFVVAALTGGVGFIAYILLWLVMPEEPAMSKNHEAKKQEASGQDQPDGGTASPGEAAAQAYRLSKRKHAEMALERRRRSSRLMVGLVLITIGLISLLQTVFRFYDWDRLWPLFLVAIGLALIWRGPRHES